MKAKENTIFGTSNILEALELLAGHPLSEDAKRKLLPFMEGASFEFEPKKPIETPK